MVVQVNIVSPIGFEKVIDLCENEEQMKGITVQHLEKKITEELKLDTDIRMVFRSKPLEESNPLVSCGIRHMSTIHTVLKRPFSPRSGKIEVQLNIVSPKGDEKVIDLCENEEEMKGITVQHLEKKITEELKLNAKIRMVFRTELLEESNLLVSYGIRHMSTIHTLLKLPGGV